MIIDCKDKSSIFGVLDKKIVNFIIFNSRQITYEEKNYFVYNVYAFLGSGDAVRLRKIYNITETDQVSALGVELTKMLEEINKKYNVVVFEGSVKDEDSSVKLFMHN
ncbi:MAG: hypothetical protein JW791_00240 [Nanoarchaeota archaeon]|nr:hypothetical protein [Nanoarchaeota archaeon]